jgi:hypothetical protein
MVRKIYIIFILMLLVFGCSTIGKNEKPKSFVIKEIEELTGSPVIALGENPIYPVDSQVKRLFVVVCKGKAIKVEEVDLNIVKNRVEKITLVDKNESENKNVKRMRRKPIMATVSGGGWTDGYDNDCVAGCFFNCMLAGYDFMSDDHMSCFNRCSDIYCRVPELANIPSRAR